jgi:hypothetical protein
MARTTARTASQKALALAVVLVELQLEQAAVKP